jgi:hypothetical protein
MRKCLVREDMGTILRWCVFGQTMDTGRLMLAHVLVAEE